MLHLAVDINVTDIFFSVCFWLGNNSLLYAIRVFVHFCEQFI